MGTPEFDFPALLDYVSNFDGWEEAGRMDRMLHFFKTKDGEHDAIVTVDEDFMEIEVDGKIMYSGDFVNDEQIRTFITGDFPPISDTGQ